MTQGQQIANARKRVKRAQRELERAGDALLKAIKATDDEISEAANGLADVHHEADADGWAGAEWTQMVAEMVLEDREAAKEEAEAETRSK